MTDKTEAQQTSLQSMVAESPTLALNMANPDFKLCQLRNNSLLRDDEWEATDQAVVHVPENRMPGMMDLREKGLVRTLGGLGVLIDQYEKLSTFTDASQSMDVATAPEEDAIDYSLAGVPVPITHHGFRINGRQLASSRLHGSMLDTTSAAAAGRKVKEKLEQVLFVGSGVGSVKSNTIYGYTTEPNRNTEGLTAAWTTATQAQILGDVDDMVNQLFTANYNGPYTLYIPNAYAKPLRSDYKTNVKGTLLDRILEYQEIEAVKPTFGLTGDNVILVQLTSDVVDLSVGEDIQTVQWAGMGGMVNYFMVMAAMVARVKSDYDGGSGICHGSI